jgi:hypothetical protein
MTAGRPPLWKDLKTFENSTQGFFEWCDENEYIPDIEALAEYLGTNRQTLREYESKQEFSYTIKNLKTKIFNRKKQLALRNKMNPAIFIFDAKNNHDYKDKIDTENITKHNFDVDPFKKISDNIENAASSETN